MVGLNTFLHLKAYYHFQFLLPLLLFSAINLVTFDKRFYHYFFLVWFLGTLRQILKDYSELIYRTERHVFRNFVIIYTC